MFLAIPSDQRPFCAIPSTTEKQAFHTHDYCILVVEDCRINQKITMRTLTRLGYPCHVVANGQQALEALHSNHYALVLMDCQMPVMDGYEATKEIRRREALSNHIPMPIIAYSTSSLDEEQNRCLEVGVNALVEKPCSLEFLEAVLHYWVGRNDLALVR